MEAEKETPVLSSSPLGNMTNVLDAALASPKKSPTKGAEKRVWPSSPLARKGSPPIADGAENAQVVA